MYSALKERVCAANLLLPEYKLITFTWGNVSEIDRARGVVAIKPSGVSYDALCPEDIVILDLDGNVLDGKLRPSSDAATHLELYKTFPNIGGVVHTHSRWATIFAQCKRGIPALGTTHADYFYGEVPITRDMRVEEIAEEYERNTGRVIAETCARPDEVPAVLVAGHGPFTWGKDAPEAVHNAVVLEEVAFMAWHCGETDSIGQGLLDKHYLRKHGTDAYYGQAGN
ncbi:MAG: L-ribulose-5-phosphate 4-epimerase [Clostridiales bacterium]|nr:L-ribulose-5-phosphate 4-epimerase [Clostridiales bacterium]